MNLLAMDTSSRGAVLALRRSDGAEFFATAAADQRHGRRFVPLIQNLLRDAAIHPGDLDVIAVATGPGSFTGLRIGLTAAKLLAYSGGAAVKALDALEILAWGAPEDFPRVYLRIDAQRGQAFAAEFERESARLTLRRTSPTRLEAADAMLPNHHAPAYLIASGPSRDRTPPAPQVVLAPEAAATPDARALLRVAQLRVEQEPLDDPWTIEPTYYRRSAAEEKRPTP